MHYFKQIILTLSLGVILVSTSEIFAQKKAETITPIPPKTESNISQISTNNFKGEKVSEEKIQKLDSNKSDLESKNPEKIKLVLKKDIYTLDFKKNPELLKFKPEYFLKFQNTLIPIDSQEQLFDRLNFLDIKTKQKAEISKEALEAYIKKLNLFGYTPQKPIKLTRTQKNWIKISGIPTRKYFDVDIDKLIKLLNHALENQTTFVKVPATYIYPKVEADEDIKNQGIKEIIAIGQSNFRGSSGARIQNIKAAIRKFNGMILKKGSIFSFNSILRSVDEKDGFVKELVIKANGNKKELGGGICQVSTTVFRTAFSGGFPLVSRRNHSYAVPYYKPHGLDATIYLGGQDFKFKNNTDGDILIQGFTLGTNLYFVFYGTSTGKTINLNGPFFGNYRKAPAPEIIETDELLPGQTRVVSGSHDGFFVRWTRTITDKDGNKTSEDLTSNYRAWPAKILKGKIPEPTQEESKPTQEEVEPTQTETLPPIRTPDYSS